MNIQAEKSPARLYSTRGRNALFASLRESIESGQLKAGDRLAPIRELAEQYDIAYGTARAVVKDLHATGLIHCEPNHQPVVVGKSANQPRPVTQKPVANDTPSRSVAIFCDARNGVLGPAVNKLTEILHLHGLRAMVVGRNIEAGPEQYDDLINYWQDRAPHAVVAGFVMPRLFDDIARVCGSNTRRIHMADSGVMPSRMLWHQVNVDHDQIGHLAIEHLLGLGHKRIGLITHRRWIETDREPDFNRKRHTGHTAIILALGHTLRERGMKHALSIHYQPAVVKNDDTQPTSQSKINDARQWLMQKDRPTAFIGEDFRLAYICLAARDLGLKMGRDFQVLGLGNTSWAHLFGFSSIDYRPDQFAQRVIQLIELEGSHWDDSPMTIHVQPQLIIRSGSDPQAGHLELSCLESI